MLELNKIYCGDCLEVMKELPARLITPPTGIVLDPFAGSGSTGISAIHENLRYLLIEKDQHYVDIANNRLKECL